MNRIAALFFVVISSVGQATTLVERAVTCELGDGELVSLIKNISSQDEGLRKPSAQLALPSVNLYELKKPISAFGYTTTSIAISPARITLVVSNSSLKSAVQKLHLEESEYSPASRAVRPTVSIVAYQLSHSQLRGKLLIGCEYANPDAARWLSEGSL